MRRDCICGCLILACLATLASCRKAEAPATQAKAGPAAMVENRGVKEGDLARITLTPEAARRLGIEAAEVEFKEARQVRTFAAEVVVPPGRATLITAPVAGTLSGPQSGPPAPGAVVKAGQLLFRVLPLAPVERNLLAGLEAEAAAASARAEAARARFSRAERLLKDQAGSAKSVETAREELTVAEATLAAAREKLERARRTPFDADAPVTIAAPQGGMIRQLLATPGQMVSAGAPLAEIAALDEVWLRVPVYSGELHLVEPQARAAVRPLGAPASSPPRLAEPVAAPPTADGLAVTSDLYYRLSNADLALRPGEKVAATLPLKGSQKRLQAPWSAILFDVHGGAWLYEIASPNVFVRRRVEVDYVSGAVAVLAHGPKPGTRVVAAGAAELFGTEFGAGK